MTQLIMEKKLPIALIILDGFGCAQASWHNAITQAKTPTLDYLYAHYPHTQLAASGSAVGLMPGVMGNSEVGHLTIGAGTIIAQDVVRINQAIECGTFFNNTLLCDALSNLRTNQRTLHLMGLLSDGMVHSSIEHLFAYIKAAHEQGVSHIAIHAFLDGRDTPPQSARHYLEKLERYLNDFPRCTLASITGRSYAMDRNKNWHKTACTYQMLTQSSTQKLTWQRVLTDCYARTLFDEHIEPTRLDPATPIMHGDSILFFNFRADRAQQLTEAFTAPLFTEFPRIPLTLSSFLIPVDYSSPHCAPTVLFPRPPISSSLKTWLNEHNLRIFTCAEREKYAHVTYFFNGGIEATFKNEQLVIVPSHNPASFADHPEMAAAAITAHVLEDLQGNKSDFYLINYANADMVGHTGNLSATIKAVEFLDQQIAQLYKGIMAKNGTVIITADHGNAEEMFDEINKQPKTAHTVNPVPFIIAQRNLFNSKNPLPLRGLADIAPFIKDLSRKRLL